MTSFRVRPPLAAAYTAASAGCPLARQARVTSVLTCVAFALIKIIFVKHW